MITIRELIKAYKSGQTNPLDVIGKALERAQKSNDELNAFVTICHKEALEKAAGKIDFNLPLAGIPIAMKDNFCTEGIRTTASAKLLDNYYPPYSATVVRKLEEAGAIIIGKTNMDAWAHGSSTETSDYGPTKNPFDVTRVPGGSSGGSAVAVAIGVTPWAIGSETAGSIRQPAAWSGIVGLKPTYGRISRYGLIAMGSSVDCPGPLTKNVEDAALLLQVLAGLDKYDATTSNKEVPDYFSEMKAGKKYTVAISDDYLEGVQMDIVKAFEKTVATLKELGHKVIKVKLISPKYAISVYTILQRAEVSSNLARFDGVRFGQPRSSFAQQAKRRMMLGAFTLSVGYYDAFYLKAQKVRTLIIEDFKQVFSKADLMLSPTTPVTALKLGESANNPMFGELMDVLIEPSTIAGIPGINIPVGLSQGLPIGMQIMAPWFEEGKILDVATQLEPKLDFYNIKPKAYYEL